MYIVYLQKVKCIQPSHNHTPRTRPHPTDQTSSSHAPRSRHASGVLGAGQLDKAKKN